MVALAVPPRLSAVQSSCEGGATLITGNLPFDDWSETFGIERLTPPVPARAGLVLKCQVGRFLRRR